MGEDQQRGAFGFGRPGISAPSISPIVYVSPDEFPSLRAIALRQGQKLDDWVTELTLQPAVAPGVQPPAYLRRFLHEVIDEGANVAVAPGSHVLRGIEI